MTVSRLFKRRFAAPIVPFSILAAAFALAVEFGPKFVADEARCAIFEPVSIRVAVLLLIFVVLASGLSLFLLGSIDNRSAKWRRTVGVWFVRRPSLFLLDFLGPIFGVCLGLVAVAFFTGYRAQAAALAVASLYVPAIALINISVSSLTRPQGLQKAAALLKESRLASSPRLVGLYLIASSLLLGWFVLPVQLASTGC